MLEELHLCGLGVIEDAVLPLAPGLTVVTGETGAGKTMVITGLSLLFGGRGDSSRVRAGCSTAAVDGRLHLPHTDPALATVTERVEGAGGELELEADGSTLLLRRVLGANGRSRAYVGGVPTPISVLNDLGEHLLVIHGQSDQLRLARAAEQRAVVDRFGEITSTTYATAYRRWREASQALIDRRTSARELRREAELLEHGLAEIEAAQLIPGEDVDLEAEANRLSHADALRLAATTAHVSLRGADDIADATDVSTLLTTGLRGLEAVAGADPKLDELTARARELSVGVEDLAADLTSYVERLEADPTRLAQLEARRAVIKGLVRRYGQDVDDVLNWAQSASARLADLDVSDAALAELAVERDHWHAEAAREAKRLSNQRQAAAKRLTRAVSAELAGLAMPNASLQIRIRQRPGSDGADTLEIAGESIIAGPDGVDEVEMLLQTHPDAAAVPLARGASGGELSRVMLAIEVCLAGSDPVATMVFDEVDSGVGGRAAIEVGRRLARLAVTHQVVVVTHLPQVAAFGATHVVVDKGVHDTVTTTDLRVVAGEERIGELARMLAGRDTAAARLHAGEMLAEAQGSAAALAP